jgi:hypothetical protein
MPLGLESMEDQHPQVNSGESWSEQFSRALGEHREQVHGFVAAEREQLAHLELELAEQVKRIAEELAQDRNLTLRERGTLDRQTGELKQQLQDLEQLKAELDVRQTEWRQNQEQAAQQQTRQAQRLQEQQADLERRLQDAETAEARLRQEQRALAIAREEHEARASEFEERRRRLEEKSAQLEKFQEKLDDRETRTRSQRHRIAGEFRAQRTEHLREFEQRRAELKSLASVRQTELDQALAAAESERDRARQQLDQVRREQERREAALQSAGDEGERTARLVEEYRRQLNDRAAEVESLQGRSQALQSELATLQEECRRLRQEGTSRAAAGAADEEAVRGLRAERDALVKRLAEAEDRLAKAPPASDKNGLDDLHRLHEMALDDLRELKARNEELAEQLAKVRSGGARAEAPAGSSMDWESQKRRMLAALESDFDEEDEQEAADRLKVEEAIRVTEEVVATRDREIGELKQLLSNQSASLGSMAVGAAALGEVLGNDEIIQQERARLRQLQSEWEEKLRQAEIDLSVERAKIARERAQIDEKLRLLEAQQAQLAELGPTGSQSKPAKPARNRWLSRLGLKELHDE